MRQTRTFGVDVVDATQNPMDLDYRAISNALLEMFGSTPRFAFRRMTHSLCVNGEIVAASWRMTFGTSRVRVDPNAQSEQSIRVLSGLCCQSSR